MTRAIDHHPVRLRRSVLSVPADNQRALAKVRDLAADAVIFDLEDAVPPDRKGEARDALVRHLAGNRPQAETIIRVNAAGSDFGEADLAAALAARPDAILLPKVESPADIQRVLDWLSERDAPEELRLWAMIETPARGRKRTGHRRDRPHLRRTAGLLRRRAERSPQGDGRTRPSRP
ncbi:citrate lyase beta subunit [Sinorhizobium medicae]